MNSIRRLRYLKERNVLLLLIAVVVTSVLLIFINYFTIKTLSALRAYTNGESQYSKGQNNASRYLIMFVYSGDTRHWEKFEEEMKVPVAGNMARVGMEGKDLVMAEEGLLMGRSHADDIGNMVWLFRNFRNMSFMQKAVGAWKEADSLIGQKYAFARSVHKRMSKGDLSDTEQHLTIEKINHITEMLISKEREFSSILGGVSRKISRYFFYVNIFMTLLIVGNVGGLAIMMVSQLNKKNHDLISTNNELDRFVYSASHDLRAPITSLKGLIEITKLEQDEKKKNHYLKLMTDTLNKQDQFIREIIDFSRNKRKEMQLAEVNLGKLVSSSLQQHEFMEEARNISIKTYIEAEKICSDALRLEIVLNNLISNAIKYHDRNKTDQEIRISTTLSGNYCNISVTDNGIGIAPDEIKKVFDMFYSSADHEMSTGLGLYITHQTIKKLGGTVHVESESGKGTTFYVSVPHNLTKAI